MKLWSDSFKDGGAIPGEFAFCVIDPVNHVAMSANKNPHLAWSDLPSGTKSLALICHDVDVPSRGDDVNQEGKSVPVDLPRVDFFHWTLIDLPVDTPVIAAGQYSNSITPRGKSGPEVPNGRGTRHGLNDYTGWFAGDADMSGEYFGYDGPCPPWNDSIVHRYVFTLYALDIERVPVDGKFTGQQVRDAIKGHVLGEASITGIYTLTPTLQQTAGAA
ncbi:YbhB/YbcL family Raf kinase inhibitor-like protein [Noviherbaspirillum cavernae]|uniref:YbhB/YbcL family Raf kinase inhibitor-like protein n=1 Tax=Noviherbaspirillum cavernae TaxID=2320862 RepID=A0A418X422_9BURK|nr:YbhB/YbcL family Raf kinase inhibitor-like protein [Noviherbaspirillum cavernae]RJG07166.1 YbhB/YbcL family Raf kinase inhibitor-like protein [Noviherbaspirillum cavernae]